MFGALMRFAAFGRINVFLYTQGNHTCICTQPSLAFLCVFAHCFLSNNKCKWFVRVRAIMQNQECNMQCNYCFEWDALCGWIYVNNLHM